MKHLSLASRYRPQTFEEVVGQNMAITALSRAASENRVAPAYLLSGTRGVGKTTIARIFAKALNCEKGPTASPCNSCPQCVHITNGNHVDVTEIDAASNTGVDDVRALRETIGFMPMEGKYKIFIVDEAHMLSKSAFNALLKTLEEPPPHTVFIFATTEAHRFPATIISRCQHFVFRHLAEDSIIAHLEQILGKENIEYEQGALRLIARRASGSVRDSLSLLDQVLSLSNGKLDEATTRESLGLAGQTFFSELFTAISTSACDRILALSSQLLHMGVDIGFFLRELSSHLRNLFLFRQSGAAILSQLNLTPDEASFIKSSASAFSATHLHAAWQMVLESQAGITHNPEPGSALELLLINLAMLPRLLPVVNLTETALPANAQIEKQNTVKETENVSAYALEKGDDGATEAISEQAPAFAEKPGAPLSWEGFCEYCAGAQKQGADIVANDVLRQACCKWDARKLEIVPATSSLWKRLEARKAQILAALDKYCAGNRPEVFIKKPEEMPNPGELRAELSNRPEIALCRRMLDATLTDCHPKDASN